MISRTMVSIDISRVNWRIVHPLIFFRHHPIFSYTTSKRGLLVMLENRFQEKLIVKLEQLFPGCLITKLDANHIQGIPDLLILYGQRWAILECKKSEDDMRKSMIKNPNQRYYVTMLNGMSYCSYIYPENEKEVLYEVQQALCT